MGNKVEKVKSNNVIQSFDDGEIHMLNVEKHFKNMLLNGRSGWLRKPKL